MLPDGHPLGFSIITAKLCLMCFFLLHVLRCREKPFFKIVASMCQNRKGLGTKLLTEHDRDDTFKLINQKVKIDLNILHIGNVGRY